MKKRKIVGTAVVGNIVEYYDFGIYAVYAGVLGKMFFPSTDIFAQHILSFCVFAIGFFMRPLGGVFFGHIGDKYGRKTALTSSIIGMAASALLISMLPTYEQIGHLAPILLLCIRLFQGLCIGGGGTGSAIFVLEHMNGKKVGLVGSVVMASNMLGTLLANCIAIVIFHYMGDHDSSWRVGFFIGGVMGLIGLYMRYNLTETPQFQKLKQDKKTVKKPLVEAFKTSWRQLILVAFLGGATASLAYMIRGYFNTYFNEVLHYSTDESLYFTSFALFNMILFLPIFGIIADKIGFKKFLYIVSGIIIITVLPIFELFRNSEHSLSIVYTGLFLYSILAAAICAPAYPYAIGSFAPQLRYSGVAFSWNLGIAIFGGTTPAIARSLSYAGASPAYYIAIVCIFFVLISYTTANKKYA